MTITREHYATYREIGSQARVLEEVVRSYPTSPEPLDDFQRILFIGCGSSLFMGQYISESWTQKSMQAVPASEVLLRPGRYRTGDSGKTLVFAFSRSGETTETVSAARLLRDDPATRICSVTCKEESSLASLGDCALVVSEAREESVVMTRAFTSILAAFLAWEEGQEPLLSLAPEIAASLKEREEQIAELALREVRNLVFLGTGPLHALACESMLKVKEMTGEANEAWQTFEFRHGPRAILDTGSLVWIYAAAEDISYLPGVMKEFRELGAECLVAGFRIPDEVAAEASIVMNFDSPLQKSHVQGIGLIHLAQLYAFFRSVHLGRNPDDPPKLSRVVKL